MPKRRTTRRRSRSPRSSCRTSTPASEPDDPELERAQTFVAVDFVVARLAAGEGVVVHCHAGRGRTGTVIGCALVRLGHDPDGVVDWLHRVQRTRGKRGWPEQAWQADVVLESANR